MQARRSKATLFTLSVVAVFALSIVACGEVLGVDFDAPRLEPATALGDSDGGPGNIGPPGSCVPKSCSELGFVCGAQDDGCGSAIECGTCDGGSCVSGKCACTPKTCPELGATCGTVDDGCGASLDCGECGNASESCVANKCECTPKNCAALGAECGTIPDGCGGTYVCGGANTNCASTPSTPHCGGVGPKCGAAPCTPKSCTGHCGSMSDGCGSILNCGGCATGTCGGGGTANVCGCTPTTCAKLGKNCGSVSNGCGGTLNCGSCTGFQTCGGGGTANVCGCRPTATACPSGQNCGTYPNGCGTNIVCGVCTSPQTCGGGGTPNHCGCTPLTCANFVCGQNPDGCGGTLSCGFCGGGGGGCFPAGSLVTMADGSQKAIETILPGEMVQTPDPATGLMKVARVTQRLEHPSDSSSAGIMVVNGVLRATRNHPILINGRVQQIEQIQVGDEIIAADGKGHAITTRVQSVKVAPGGMNTFDLILDGPNAAYFVNTLLIQPKLEP